MNKWLTVGVALRLAGLLGVLLIGGLLTHLGVSEECRDEVLDELKPYVSSSSNLNSQ